MRGIALLLGLGLAVLAGCAAEEPQYDCVTTSYDLTECSLREGA